MQRIKDFVLSRKRPVTVEDIMDRFLVSRTTACNAINSLLFEGKVRRLVKNRKYHYQPNHRANFGGGHKSLGAKVLFQLPELERLR